MDLNMHQAHFLMPMCTKTNYVLKVIICFIKIHKQTILQGLMWLTKPKCFTHIHVILTSYTVNNCKNGSQLLNF